MSDQPPLKVVSFKSGEERREEQKSKIDEQFKERIIEALNGKLEAGVFIAEREDGNMMIAYAAPGLGTVVAMLEAAKLTLLLSGASR